MNCLACHDSRLGELEPGVCIHDHKDLCCACYDTIHREHRRRIVETDYWRKKCTDLQEALLKAYPPCELEIP